MAIDLFQIEWTKLFPFNTALLQPETKEKGVYALYRSAGKAKRLYYIGKSGELGDRLGAHKQSMFRMMSEAERKKCFVSFGLISFFGRSRMSRDIDDTQLKSVENFLITSLQPIGCGENTKKRYTGDYPMIVVNTGKVAKPFNKFMSQSSELLKILGKDTATKKKPASSWLP